MVPKLSRWSHLWKTGDPKLLTRLDVPQVQRLIAVSKPPIVQLAGQVPADDQELAATEPNQNVQLVALDEGAVGRRKDDGSVRVPRRSLEPDKGIVVLGQVIERKGGTRHIRIQAVSVEPPTLETEFSRKLGKLV
jgi:hypothetical protein